jgi:hypothetical protein
MYYVHQLMIFNNTTILPAGPKTQKLKRVMSHALVDHFLKKYYLSRENAA